MTAKKNKPQRAKKSLRRVVVLLLAAFAVFAVLVSPLFEIRHISVEGNNTLTAAEIIRASGLETGQNILGFRARRSANYVNAIPFVRHAAVSRQFPYNVVITVVERVAVASIRVTNTGTYLLIDDGGMVLSAGSPRGGLLLVTGVEPTHFAVGDYLEVEDPIVFQNILYLSRVFRRYEFSPDIIDMSNPTDIVLHKGLLDILFGPVNDADRKVRYLQAIIEQFPVGDRGYIYIRDASARPRFGLIR